MKQRGNNAPFSEVKTMTELIFDKTARKKAKYEKAIEIAKKMFLNNEPLDKIIEYTELSEKEIEYIKKIL